MQISGFDKFEDRFRESRITQELKFAMEDTVEFTKEVIVDAIENSGTDRQWVRPWYGRTHSGKGRVDTGEMRDSVNTEVTVLTDGVVEGKVGWLDGSPAYAEFQELGFRHWITGEFIQGMMSLREGAEQGSEEAIRLLDEAARNIAK